jgi:hypothetical protein
MTLVGGPLGTAVGTPVVNAGAYYINGLYLTWVSTTSFSIANGACRDSTNQNDIVFGPTVVTTTNPFTTTPSTLTVSTGHQGPLGLDIGTIAVSTLYAVYIVGDSLGNNPTTAVISLSFTQPLLPFGYDSYRRIGAIKTDGAGLVLAFHQEQPGGQPGRRMWYDIPISVLAAAAGAAFAAVSLAPAVPAIQTNVTLQADLLPNAPADFVELRPTGSAAANGNVKMSGDVAAVHHFDQLMVCCAVSAGNASIDWITDAASTVQLSVSAYVDHL